MVRVLGFGDNAGISVSFDFFDDSTDDYYAAVAPNVNYAFMSCVDMDVILPLQPEAPLPIMATGSSIKNPSQWMQLTPWALVTP